MRFPGLDFPAVIRIAASGLPSSETHLVQGVALEPGRRAGTPAKLATLSAIAAATWRKGGRAIAADR